MKRSFPFLLILLVCMLLAACGGDPDGSDVTTNTTTAPITTTQPTTTTTAAITTTTVTTAAVTTTAPVTTTAAAIEEKTPEALLDAANAALLAEKSYRATLDGRFLPNDFISASLLPFLTLSGEQYVNGSDASLSLCFAGVTAEAATVGNVAYASYPSEDGVKRYRYRAEVEEGQKAALVAKIVLPPMELSAFSNVSAGNTGKKTLITCEGADASVIEAINRALAGAAPHIETPVGLQISSLRLSITLLSDGRYESITAASDARVTLNGLPINALLQITYRLDYDGGRALALPTDIDTYTEVNYTDLLEGLIPESE